MALLDELKRQAERVRADEQSKLELQARQEAFYRADIRPAMQRIRDYLVELLDQLKVVQPEIRGEFGIPGRQAPVRALQSLPILTLDSRDNPRRLSLRLEYGVDNLRFRVEPRQDAEEARAFLDGAGQTFSDWPVRGPGDEIIGLHFAVDKFRVPASLEILADVEQQRLVFASVNIRSFHQQQDQLPPTAVDADWLDRLGLYLLGQGSSPVRLQIGDAERAALQRQVEEDRARRERELAEAERLAQEQEEAARLENRVRRLLGSIKDKLPLGTGK